MKSRQGYNRWLATRLELQLRYSLRFVVPEQKYFYVSSKCPRTFCNCDPLNHSRTMLYRRRIFRAILDRKFEEERLHMAVIRLWKIYLYLLEKLLLQPLFHFHRSKESLEKFEFDSSGRSPGSTSI